MYGFRKLFDARHSYISKKELKDMVVGYRITKNKVNSKITNYTFSLDLIIRKYDDVILNLSDQDIFHRSIEMYLKDITDIERIAMIDQKSCLVRYKRKKLDIDIVYYYLTRGIEIPDFEQIKKYMEKIDRIKKFKNWQELSLEVY